MRFTLIQTAICLVGLALTLANAPSAVAGKLPDKFTNGFCAPRFDAASKTSYGIDVSVYQGDIDWTKVNVNTGILYTFIRASEGFVEDKKFQQNWAGAGKQCLLRGVYHFFVDALNATEQAEKLLERLKEAGALEPELAIAVDIEQKSASPDLCRDQERASRFVSRLETFIKKFEADSKQKLAIYTNNGFWNCLSGTDEIAKGRKLWIAHYTRDGKPDKPTVPAPWKTWTFWQFFDNGRAAGISGAVDADRFDGSGADLIKFAEEN